MARGFTKHLQVTAALVGLALFAASLAPAEVPRKQSDSRQRARVEARAPVKQKTQPKAQVLPAAADVPTPPVRPASAPQAEPAPDVVAAPAPAELPAEARLNMVRTAPEQIGQVPGHFFWIRQGLQAAQDPVDGQIVFINDDGRVLGRAKLPPGFNIGEIFSDAKEVRLIDAGRRQVTIPRTIDPAAAGPLQETAVAASGSARLMRLTRRSDEELLYHDERRAGSRALNVRSVAGGMLAQAYEIGPGSGDNRYLVTEEITGVKPALQVRVFVQRFDRTGRLTGVVHVSLDGMDVVPRDFIAVTGEGIARVLLPTDSGVKINEIEFAAPPKAGRRPNDNELKGLGRLLRTTPVDSNVTGDKSPLLPPVRSTFKITVPAPPVRRDAVLESARSYLAVNWVMTRENFEKPGVENRCEPTQARFWLRPRRFTEAMIGTTIGPMPYRWGGDDTPETYRLRAEWGALAGSVCTCRDVTLNYCLFPESAGVDCSGFVSRAWGIDKRGTSGLLDVANDVDSVGELKPGDAFNWPGRHIRLFAGSAPGAALSFTVIESSTRLDCEGVCERAYRPSEVNGYRMIRYRGIADDDTPVAQPNGAAPTNGATLLQTAAPAPQPNGTTAARRSRATKAWRR